MSTTTASAQPVSSVNGRPQEDVWSYPRPPRLERTPLQLRVVWTGASGEKTVLADTREGYRVLETSHPPTYYLPPDSVNTKLLSPSDKRQTHCEWKGKADYFDFNPPGSSHPVTAPIWTYKSPTPAFAPIAGYFAFYPAASTRDGAWHAEVEGERVQAQDGDFYGGWKTDEIVGRMKGGPGTWGW